MSQLRYALPFISRGTECSFLLRRKLFTVLCIAAMRCEASPCYHCQVLGMGICNIRSNNEIQRRQRRLSHVRQFAWIAK